MAAEVTKKETRRKHFFVNHLFLFVRLKHRERPAQKSSRQSKYPDLGLQLTAHVFLIRRRGEQKASRALREASEIIGDSPAALQLRYLQVCLGSSQIHATSQKAP